MKKELAVVFVGGIFVCTAAAAPIVESKPANIQANKAEKEAQAIDKVENIKQLFSDAAVDQVFPNMTAQQRAYLKKRNKVFRWLLKQHWKEANE